jgi:hypothetical protein
MEDRSDADVRTEMAGLGAMVIMVSEATLNSRS